MNVVSGAIEQWPENAGAPHAVKIVVSGGQIAEASMTYCYPTLERAQRKLPELVKEWQEADLS